ncbi:hypothetical protein H6G54_29710 [Anabaena cylindrica FACHB-243]|uniref:hypothetical protein n=1 Tax=Anabaena sp. PCC 7938 TaxID=1296340 RepID=UPI00030E5F39|nr:hypothetical protein [Anabaena sp. CCAP 1446/1C]MBD2421778.1 hypothetical protein [Anabaena cylindrica FACHB-243]MEA5551350.1 hypothetical protein [Anabaena cylindrica UHCC 0172]MBY5284203.1 hypothetical protein [Anabaena sp. CCAP 1446/1C]MBY5306450.1 hypothetical protein [Anabaena sp. CCAP 1446/1C]MCM2408035.1 hypothetical protein [Anabaena sp. CCAP 1446/1C]
MTTSHWNLGFLGENKILNERYLYLQSGKEYGQRSDSKSLLQAVRLLGFKYLALFTQNIPFSHLPYY